MSTERPRVQSYLDPEVYQKFKEFQKEQELKESAALNQILKEYFGLTESNHSASTSQALTVSELKFLIQEELWGESNADFIEGIKEEARQMISQQVSEAKEFWRTLDCKESIASLQKRVRELEEICKPIEGLAELSKPIEFELPSELNLSQLARRLGISKSVVSRRKDKADFEEWSRGKDPDAIAWRYDAKNQKFVRDSNQP